MCCICVNGVSGRLRWLKTSGMRRIIWITNQTMMTISQKDRNTTGKTNLQKMKKVEPYKAFNCF